MPTTCEFDPTKRRTNLAKHGLDLAGIPLLDVPRVLERPRTFGDEQREKAIGAVDGRLAALMFRRRGDAIRLISLRRARDENEDDMVRYTAHELRAMLALGESRTDWARVDAMTEQELEAAIASDPDWANVPRNWWRDAVPRGPGLEQVLVNLPRDLAAWLRAKGGAMEAEAVVALRQAMRAEQGAGSPPG